jgi:hypothetical protein
MENNNGGFIVIARKIKSWGWYSDPTTFCLFIHLLIMANWKDGYFEGRLIKRGQLATSIKSLALKTGLSIKQVKGSLNKLRGTHEITTEGLARYTVITVVAYDQYQSKGPSKGQQRDQQNEKSGTTKGTTKGPQYNNKRKNKEKEKINKKEMPTFFEWIASHEAPFESVEQRNKEWDDFRAQFEDDG